MACRARSRSTTPSCSPTRTSTKWRGSTPTAASKSSFASQFEGDFKFSLQPGGRLSCRGQARRSQGRPGKRKFGAWMMPAIPAAGQDEGPARHRVRHLWLQTDDRKLERDLIVGYEKDVATVLGLLSPVTHDTVHRNPLAAGPHPRLRPGQGKGGARRQGALRPARRRPRQPAAGAKADRSGVEEEGATRCPLHRHSPMRIARLRARHLARARNPLARKLCSEMDSGLVLRTPRNDVEARLAGKSAVRTPKRKRPPSRSWRPSLSRGVHPPFATPLEAHPAL